MKLEYFSHDNSSLRRSFCVGLIHLPLIRGSSIKVPIGLSLWELDYTTNLSLATALFLVFLLTAPAIYARVLIIYFRNSQKSAVLSRKSVSPPFYFGSDSMPVSLVLVYVILT